jgi:photosystem II stability/assembly factor-like uncharacterized protein
MRTALLLLAITATAQAQWDLQTSNTTASLRGIHALGNGIAWASGTEGTVLHTTDNGAHWQRCTTPPDADKLDFRGIQAFDANTAIVMSSGKGDLSRLYKTTDACQTWRLVAVNPDKEGFWDTVKLNTDTARGSSAPADFAYILGDSVDGKLKLWEWKEGWEERELETSYDAPTIALTGESSFAASNSALQVDNNPQIDKTWKYMLRWASGTKGHAYISYVRDESTATCEPCRQESARVEIPMAADTQSAGIFSFAFRDQRTGVAVGGNYEKPAQASKTAAFTTDGGKTWQHSPTPPHGYRSAVAYDAPTKTWITVGPNGTDISTDDGRNWRALKPSPGQPDDADQHWNALSLPFVVGPHGRIGILNPAALKPR